MSTTPKDPTTARVIAEMPNASASVPKASTAPKPAPKKKATPKPAAKKATTAKPRNAKATTKPAPKTPGKKAAKYPSWVPAAVKTSRHISGQKLGSGGDATVAYPGPRQHIAIRKVVTAKIDGPVTADAIIKVSGVKNLATLRRIATWEADKSAMAPMRPLSAECGRASGVNGNVDGWAVGRFLASALVAWVDEIRAADKAS